MIYEVQKILLDALGTESELHLVGGAVRDVLDNRTPKDFDFASKLTPQEVQDKLNIANIHSFDTGIRRGTITAHINIDNEKIPVEITTFRQPGAETRFSNSILADLPARDFTINAMAIRCIDHKIIDPFNGFKDLQNGIIRAVGNPKERFIEDPHRILRMVRFGFAQEGRDVELYTFNAARECVDLIKNVSAERVRDEFTKIICCNKASAALRLMNEVGILAILLPDLMPCIDFDQNHHHVWPVFDHILAVVDRVRPIPVLRLAALFHDIAKPLTMTIGDDGIRHFLRHEQIGAEMAVRIMNDMKFPRELTRDVKTLVSEHMRTIRMGDKGIRKIIKELDDLLPLWVELKFADTHAGHTSPEKQERFDDFERRVEFEKNRVDVPKFNIIDVNGDDILALGFKSGPIIREILKTLEDAVLEDPTINHKEKLLDLAKVFIKFL